MNLELAKRLLKIGAAEAKNMGKPCSIALVDENGWLVALYRMDGAPIPTAEIARDKAWTAAVFRRPSSEVSAYGDPRVPGFGLNAQNWNDRLTTIPGGFPIWDGDLMIGAIGACGATPEEDVFLCQEIIEKIFRDKIILEFKEVG
ncbi:MAG: heme-binding protein [Deltaproteobacteria bacterium]|nr:heme-binding protein [Deltaproteobacteria bacterium]